MVIIVTSVFHAGNKNYQKIFLDECLYNLLVLKHDRINMSESININKTNGSLECIAGTFSR